MPHWWIKAAIQGVLSQLPQPQRWNRLLQRHVTRSLDLDDTYFLSKWHQCQRHVSHLAAHRGTDHLDFTALELGTGWFPITPIGLALAGGRRVYTIDTQDLLATEQVIDTLEAYRRLMASGDIELPPRAGQRIDRLLDDCVGKDARELLGEIGVEALIADARDSGLPDDSIDLICSNNTLEHIPRELIVELFTEFRRLLSAAGLMSHHIDMADHYVNFDSSITVYNFLRFSDQQWSRFNNSLQYQNRLRITDFRDIHSETGFSILAEDNAREDLDVLRSVPLADKFQGYDESDLAVYATWLQSRPGRL